METVASTIRHLRRFSSSTIAADADAALFALNYFLHHKLSNKQATMQASKQTSKHIVKLFFQISFSFSTVQEYQMPGTIK